MSPNGFGTVIDIDLKGTFNVSRAAFPLLKAQGGVISHLASDIEVRCLPANLPEFIEVDLADAEIGTIIHLSDLKAPKGVEFVALAHGDDKAVANVHAPRVAPEATEEGAAE